MAKTRRPTLVSGLLLFGTVALVAGTAALAGHPVTRMMTGDRADVVADARRMIVSERAMAQAGPSPLPTLTATTPQPLPTAVPVAPSPVPSTSARPPEASASRTVTYTVKRGDTLGGIAAWFDQRGFGPLYRANRAVIGNDPDLIRPGQRIIISGTRMTVSPRR